MEPQRIMIPSTSPQILIPNTISAPIPKQEKKDADDRAYQLDHSFCCIAEIEVMYTERTEKNAKQSGCHFGFAFGLVLASGIRETPQFKHTVLVCGTGLPQFGQKLLPCPFGQPHFTQMTALSV